MAEIERLLDDERVALAAPVRVELLAGASRATFARLRRVLSALPVYFPTDLTWRSLESFLERSIAAGQRFGFGDLLIAAIAAEHEGTVWSRDRDFERMARLGFVGLHRV